jgi:aryl-alcohol dehydrogenase-like predicted oxidoreductase
VEKIRAAEVPAGMAMSQWAIAWCLKDPVVSATIPGCKDAAQAAANAAAADLAAEV